MAGRFLAVPFLLAVGLLARGTVPRRRPLAAVLVVMAAALLVPRNPLTAAWRYDMPPDFHGIVDERGYYHRWTGLVSRLRADHVEYEWVTEGRRAGAAASARGGGFQAVESAGMYGFHCGPDMYLVDRFALADAFLARLPANRTWFRGGWRIGHFYRDLPEGYYESVGADRNLLRDPALRVLYDDVQKVTTGPLFDGERWGAIWRLNTGGGPSGPTPRSEGRP
jgi:arabinofuranosyltransferase